MPLLPGDGTCLKTMFAESVEYSSMAHVLPASIQEMTVHYVCIPRPRIIPACCSYIYSPRSNWQMWTLFPYGTSSAFSFTNGGILIVLSIVFLLGYTKTLRRGYVPCVDRVCLSALEGSGIVR